MQPSIAAATIAAPPTGQSILDEVMYLASLASDRAVIDPIMDSVRAITANVQTGSTLSNQDIAGLQAVKTQLTDHLLHDDKLRVFTAEELNQQTTEAIGVAGRRHESLWMIIRTVLVATAAYPVGVAVTITTHAPDPLALASAFSTTTLYAGLIWVYVSALDTFRAELKVAYRWLCFDMLALCAAAVVSTILNSFPSVAQMPLLSYGEAVMYIGLLSALIGYEGMRRFAHAVGLKAILVWPVVLVGGFILGGLTWLIPHATVPNEAAFHISALLWILVGSFSLSVAVLGLRSAHLVTTRYAQAISWFSVAYVQATIISLAVLIAIFVHGPIYAGLPLLAIEMAMATCGISLVIAGYKFLRSVGKS